MQTITAIIKKHLYAATNFDMFSASVLLNDPDDPVSVDQKYQNLTIKGEGLEKLHVGSVRTFGLTKDAKNPRFPNTYTNKIMLNAYPNIADQQIEFIDNLLAEKAMATQEEKAIWYDIKSTFMQAGTDGVNTLIAKKLTPEPMNEAIGEDTDKDAVLKDRGAFNDLFENELETSNPLLEDTENNNEVLTNVVVDLVDVYKKVLKTVNPKAGPLVVLSGLKPFSPLAQYLTAQHQVNQTDALALVDALMPKLSVFKENENNLFALYHDAPNLPIASVINVQQRLNPTADLTPNNGYFLDATIRHILEKNLFDTKNEYLTLNELIYQLSGYYPVAYDWQAVFSNYKPKQSAKFKIITTADETYFVPNTAYYCAKKISKFFSNAHSRPSNLDILNTSMVAKYGLEFEPSDEQKQFVQHALDHEITLLTGAAGTGKSLTISALTKVLKKDNKSFILLAPTAKAAQQITKYAHATARTIHSHIAKTKEADPNEIKDNYVIIDEMSMTDAELFKTVTTLIANINSVRKDDNKLRLILAGDISQLLPVAYGAPFRDALNLYPDLTIRLTKIYRQANPDLIDTLQLARKGEFQLENIGTARGNQITHVNSKIAYMPYYSAAQVANLIASNIPNFTAGSYDMFGIIAPLVKLVEELNEEIKARLNPVSDPLACVIRKGLKNSDILFSVNDPIVLTNNTNYIDLSIVENEHGYHEPLTAERLVTFEKRMRDRSGKFTVTNKYLTLCFNGDTGYVSRVISPNAFVVTLTGCDGEHDVLIHREHLTFSNIELAYALTVHKSQGSQFQHLIYVNTFSRPSMSSRNMVYTAMSRTKEDIIIFSNSQFSNIAEERRTIWPILMAQTKN